jgi:predicted MPP superfamily phosphohydrolase
MKGEVSQNRRIWSHERKQMEALLAGYRRSTIIGERAFPIIAYFTKGIAFVLHLTGLYKYGHQNAKDFRLEHASLSFSDLPHAFDGYTILHMSDLHVGTVPGLLERVALSFRGLTVDLVVMSGDYQTHGTPPAAEVSAQIKQLLNSLIVRDGIIAVLGNHDSHEMADILDELNVITLINEGIIIERGGSKLKVVGTDDVNSFYTKAAPLALKIFNDGFRIIVVHTPDLASVAAEAGYSLYLTGHTHGGQVCMIKDHPIVTALDTHHALASGFWMWKGMQGHTSRGLGSGKTAVRFNCPPEAKVIRLRRS